MGVILISDSVNMFIWNANLMSSGIFKYDSKQKQIFIVNSDLQIWFLKIMKLCSVMYRAHINYLFFSGVEPPKE